MVRLTPLPTDEKDHHLWNLLGLSLLCTLMALTSYSYSYPFWLFLPSLLLAITWGALTVEEFFYQYSLTEKEKETEHD